MQDMLNEESVTRIEIGAIDSLFKPIAEFVVKAQDCPIAYIQEKFSLGASRTDRIVSQLTKAGIISKARKNEPRVVLVKDQQELEIVYSRIYGETDKYDAILAESNPKSEMLDIEIDDYRLEEVLEFAAASGTMTISYLQRKLGFGFARASTYISHLETLGFLLKREGSSVYDFNEEKRGEYLAKIQAKEQQRQEREREKQRKIEEEKRTRFLNQTISAYFGFSNNKNQALLQAGINTIGDLLSKSEDELQNILGLGFFTRRKLLKFKREQQEK